MDIIKEADAPASKARIASYLYFSSLYFIAVGVLYLWGYWLPFGINILEYMSLTDVLKSTAFPITLILLLLTASVALNILDRKRFEEGIKPRQKWLLWVLGILWIILTLLVSWPKSMWLFGAMALIIPATKLTLRSEWVKCQFPSAWARLAFVFISIATLIGSPFYGHFKGYEVRAARDFYFLTSDVAGVTVSENAKPTERLRFLGHAGEFAFMYDPTKEATIISKVEAGKPIVLKQYNQEAIRNSDRIREWLNSFEGG